MYNVEQNMNEPNFMQSMLFDTHSLIKDLQKNHDFSEKQAEGVVSTLAKITYGELATKKDICDLKLDIANFRAENAEFKLEIKSEIIDFRAEMAEFKAEIYDKLNELKLDIEALKAQMNSLEMRLTIKLGSIMVICTGLMATIIKLF
ncbi:MAG: hypothetical protein ACK4OM_00875 [Alphaproteobacteria bacterium]